MPASTERARGARHVEAFGADRSPGRGLQARCLGGRRRLPVHRTGRRWDADGGHLFGRDRAVGYRAAECTPQFRGCRYGGDDGNAFLGGGDRRCKRRRICRTSRRGTGRDDTRYILDGHSFGSQYRVLVYGEGSECRGESFRVEPGAETTSPWSGAARGCRRRSWWKTPTWSNTNKMLYRMFQLRLALYRAIASSSHVQRMKFVCVRGAKGSYRPNCSTRTGAGLHRLSRDPLPC